MTYAETLDYLFTRLPMYQRAGATAMKKDLGNIRRLLDALGNPERRMGRIVHVAGTNGKGTTCHLIAAALQAHGHRVGMYTSPHYRDFRERIKINAAFIPEENVVNFVDRHRALIEEVAPSFFEITVALAFQYFAERAVDWSVIEVGLGGRLDSTNVVTPVLSVITNIGLDHTQFLGDTLELIAGEKAGIIKPGVPVVVGETQTETLPVFERIAAENDSPLIVADRDFPLEYYPGFPQPPGYYTTAENAPYHEPVLPDIGGPHALKNLNTALATLYTLAKLKKLNFKAEALEKGLQNVSKGTYYVGRFQYLQRSGPTVLADSAHNTEGLRPVTNFLRGIKQPLHVVLGVVNDKDLTTALPLFPPTATYYFCKADIPRGLPAEELRAAAVGYGLPGEAYGSVREAYGAAVAAAGENGFVFVGGSVFVVAEVL